AVAFHRRDDRLDAFLAELPRAMRRPEIEQTRGVGGFGVRLRARADRCGEVGKRERGHYWHLRHRGVPARPLPPYTPWLRESRNRRSGKWKRPGPRTRLRA